MNNLRSFTLLECLIVIVVIGTVAAMAVPSYVRYVERSKTAEGIGILKSLADAQSRYRLEEGAYAASINDLDISIPAVGNFSAPVALNGPDNIASIASAPAAYTLFIQRNGRVYCTETVGGACDDSGCSGAGTLVDGTATGHLCN